MIVRPISNKNEMGLSGIKSCHVSAASHCERYLDRQEISFDSDLANDPSQRSRGIFFSRLIRLLWWCPLAFVMILYDNTLYFGTFLRLGTSVECQSIWMEFPNFHGNMLVCCKPVFHREQRYCLVPHQSKTTCVTVKLRILAHSCMFHCISHLVENSHDSHWFLNLEEWTG